MVSEPFIKMLLEIFNNEYGASRAGEGALGPQLCETLILESQYPGEGVTVAGTLEGVRTLR